MKHGIVAGLLLLCLPLISGAAFATPQPNNGLATVLDSRSGAEVAHVSANGAVVAAIADGRGGWFVAGSFTRLGGRRRVAVAHVLASGAVDPSWRAAISSASGRSVAVYALARDRSRLFVGGPFGRVDGARRPGLAALDPRTGALVRRWSPRPQTWLDVGALLVAGRRLLVARQSTYPIPGITALDTRNGAVDRRWNAHLLLIGDAGSFNTLLLRRSRVYVAGSFHIAGVRRNGLVALAARDGTLDRRFAPRVPDCSVCNGFAVLYGLASSRRRLYVTGSFDRVAGVRRNGVAALDPRTGAVDLGWRPARGGREITRAVVIGSRLYLGGRDGLWALDAGSGAIVRLPRVDVAGEVLALAVSGRRLLVAGRD